MHSDLVDAYTALEVRNDKHLTLFDSNDNGIKASDDLMENVYRDCCSLHERLLKRSNATQADQLSPPPPTRGTYFSPHETIRSSKIHWKNQSISNIRQGLRPLDAAYVLKRP